MRRLAVTLVVLAALIAGAALAVHALSAPSGPTRSVDPSPGPSTVPSDPAVPVIGVAGTFGVATTSATYVTTARTVDVNGQTVPRSLPVQILYPSTAGGRPVTPPASGYPLVVFAPGYLQCATAYDPLLRSWAAAGYVVAGIKFPVTNCTMNATAADENDIINQPGDMAFVITQLLAASAAPKGPLKGLIDPDQVAVAGHSDGADTAAALVAASCYANARVQAAVILAGAEMACTGGSYFSAPTPPMLFAQGTQDTTNNPATSLKLYGADTTGVRYYLQLDGAGHYTPFQGQTPPEPTVARVTLDFLNRYLLGDTAAAAALQADGNVAGVSSLVSGGTPPPAVPAPPAPPPAG